MPSGFHRARRNKGTVSSVGADRLTEYCNRVSAMSDASLRLEGAGIAHALYEEFNAVRESLTRYLAVRRVGKSGGR